MISDHTFFHATTHAWQHEQDEIREAFPRCATGLFELRKIWVEEHFSGWGEEAIAREPAARGRWAALNPCCTLHKAAEGEYPLFWPPGRTYDRYFLLRFPDRACAHQHRGSATAASGGRCEARTRYLSLQSALMTIAEACCYERLRYEEHGALRRRQGFVDASVQRWGAETALYIHKGPHTIQSLPVELHAPNRN